MNLVIVLLFFLNLPIVGMEKAAQSLPEQVQPIPKVISSDYANEEIRFKRYPFDDPQKMSEFLQSKLKKGTDPLTYLASLQRFASKLVIQETAVQNCAYENYAANKFRSIYDEMVKIMIESGNEYAPREYGGTRIQFLVIPQTDEQLNEMITHKSILLKPDFDFNERKFFYSWILDKTKGPWLNSFGKARVLAAELSLLHEELSHLSDMSITFHYPACWLSISKEPVIIKDNISFFNRLCSIMEVFAQQEKKMQEIKHQIKGIEQTRKDFEKNLSSLVLLYEHVAHWYAQLYKAIRVEMKRTIIELLQQKKGDLSFIQKLSYFKQLNPLTEEQKEDRQMVPLITNLQAKKFIPLDLPDVLPAWINPSTIISFPSYDSEFEAFKTEWEKTHPVSQSNVPSVSKKPAKKRVKKRVIQPSSPPAAASSSLEKTREEVEPEEIQVAADGSYIEEGDETALNITIHNPKNNTIEIVYKSDPNELKNQEAIKNTFLKKYYPPDYTQWVKMWAKNPDQALTEQGYRDQHSKKFKNPAEHLQVIAYHDFSILIDDLIPQWGIVTLVPSRRDKNKKHILVTIPGKMILEGYPKNYPEREATGIYSYLIDTDNGEWYHRMFEPKSGKQLLKELLEQGYYSPQMTGVYDVYFPALPTKQK